MTGFKTREDAASAAWKSYSSRPNMSHDFRAGFHRASIAFSRPDVSGVMKEESTPAGFYVAIGAIAGGGVGISVTLVILSAFRGF